MIVKVLNKDNIIEQQAKIDEKYVKELQNALIWFKNKKNIDKFQENFDCFYLFEPLKTFETNDLSSFLSHILIESGDNCEEFGYLRDSLSNFITNLTWKPYYYRRKFT